MKPDEAMTIVGMVMNSWPGSTVWNEDQMIAYAEGIVDLDAEHVTNGLITAVKELKFRPTVAELREFARVQRLLASREDHHNIPPEKPHRPKWVERWARARDVGDLRPFVEQANAMRDQGHKVPDAFISDRDHWIQEDEYNDGPVPKVGGIT